MASRSTALALEVKAMDRIERAIAGIDELPDPAARARVRRWAAETCLSGLAEPDGSGKPDG